VRDYEFVLIAIGAILGSGWGALTLLTFSFGADWPRALQYVLAWPVLAAFLMPAWLQPFGVVFTIFAMGAALGALAAGGVVAYYRFKYR
jgi:hypothetical protein